MSTTNFEVGDKVSTIGYDNWDGVLDVVEISGNIIIIRHPTYGLGGFTSNELTMVEKKNKDEFWVLNIIEEQVDGPYKSMDAVMADLNSIASEPEDGDELVVVKVVQKLKAKNHTTWS